MPATDKSPQNYARPSDADFAHTLKAGFRDLVRKAGGQEIVASLIGTSQSRVSENASANFPDCTPRVHHVAILEADIRQPVITKLLAERAGYELVPLGSFGNADPHTHLARIIKDTGEVAGALSQALADGRISAQEAIEALHSLIAQMNGVIEEGGK